MTRMFSPARMALAAGFALLCPLVWGYASAQSPPAAPTIDSVTSGDTTLTVAWTAPTGASGITAYDVRHIETSADETDDANWAVEDNAWTSGALQYTITGLINGTEYDVQVRAVDSNGDGTWSDTKTGTPALPAPTIDSVRADDRAVMVSWSALTGITTVVLAYDVRYIETSGDETVDSNWTVEEDAWEEGGGSLAYPVTGLTNGTEYDVQLRAVDVDDVDGAWSATTSATPADHGNTRAAATSVTADARVWGVSDPTNDEDYFSFSVSSTADYWIYTLGDLDTVGELLDSGGMSIDTSDRGGALPSPENFFLWHRLQSGTYYIKVTGYGPTDEPYILRIREFTDTTSRSNAATLNLDGSASGTIDPEDDADYFKLELSAATEVAIRGSGFPDTIGELQRSNGRVIAYNDDGYLPGGIRNFLIRKGLAAGVYYVKVRSFGDSDGPYSVYASAITEPGSTEADAQPLTLGVAAGGNIEPAGDQDYFSLTLTETTYLTIGGVSKVTSISAGLTDENDLPAPLDLTHFDDLFVFDGKLDAGTYYLKVTGKGAADTGRYTVRAILEAGQTLFVDRCSNISRSAGINDPLYGCQWHLKNNDQFRNSGGQDIRVEEVWPTYTGSGINVAVVDDGMHHQHEDLTDNVLTSFNHNYDPDLTDIYHPFETHGTAVAGLIAAKDNSLGMRGVAPEAKIYGYNYLVEQSDANEANAMSRNAATTAISNNSWGPGDSGQPEPATELWETAVKDGVTTGYGGKGVFYAWGAGNGGGYDYSTLDEFSNFYAVTAVCAVGHDDIRSSYSEAGANLWVCGPSSSGREGQPRIATTDNGHRYQGSFGGTSAATPIVSGVVALVREANSALTWRDVKLILAASARKNDPDNTGWVEGAFKYGSATDRYNFNHEYGFGMVDAKAATDLAPGWTNVGDLREITSESSVINLPIPDLPSSGTPNPVTTSLTIDPFVDFVEFVEVNTHFNHPYFRDLTVELVSPSGAVSTLATYAPLSGALTTEFRFGSARHLGEDPAGEWTLRIKDSQRGDSGTLRSWGLTIYGHGSIPGAPDIDNVTPGGGTLEIDWKAPTDTGETAITSYDLRYIREDATDKSDDEWALETGVGTPSNRSYTITGLIGGVKYEIQLRANNDSGPGPWSQAAGEEPTTAAPSAPSITDVTRGDRTLAVVWTAPADNGGGVITAYDVGYIETSADETVESNWTVRHNAWRSGDLRYTITNLTNATEYDVQVRAVNSAGDGAWSGTETGTPLPDDIPITLEWEETSFDVAEDAGSVVLTAVFTTTLDAPPEADFTFDVTLTTSDRGATRGDDYTAPPSSATFVASDFGPTNVNGQQRYRATRDFIAAIIDDTADEREEDFRVSLAYLTPGLPHLQGGPATATVTIQDNDPPEVSGMVAINYAENGSGRVARYTATNPENATITWSLAGVDVDDFEVSAGSLTFKTPPDFENPTDRSGDNNTYEVTVQASDGTATGTLPVTVTVDDANEAPEFPSTETGDRSVAENLPLGAIIGVPVEAEDVDINETLTYGLSGGGASSFVIDEDTGQLETGVSLDHEARNSYSLTVSVRDSKDTAGNPDTRTDDNIRVTITVTDENDEGEVTLSPSQPRVAARLSANLNDPDGNISGESWEWHSSQDQAIWSFIVGADTSSYTPVDGDVGRFLRATVFYTDQHGGGNRAEAESTNAVRVAATNRSPAFTDGASTTRSVPENTAAGDGIGDPIAASDPNGDRLTYSLGGTDAASFDILASSGQLQTKAALNYEARNTYAVTMSVRDGKDPEGNADSRTDDTIGVTINVTDVNETPPRTARRSGGGGGGGGGGGIVPSRPPAFITGARTAITITGALPSGANAGRPVAAADATDYGLTYSLAGPDAALFTIDQSTGQIRVAPGTTLDYQARRNTYTVDVTARNIFGATATTRVTITVTSAALGSLGSRYDADNNEAIDLEEVLPAIADYFNDRISLEDLLEVIRLYFSS